MSFPYRETLFLVLRTVISCLQKMSSDGIRYLYVFFLLPLPVVSLKRRLVVSPNILAVSGQVENREFPYGYYLVTENATQ